MFAANGSRRRPSTNNLDNLLEGQDEAVSFASVLTVGLDAMSKRYWHPMMGKGKKSERVATVGRPTYMPVKFPSSWDAHLQAMAVGLEATNAILSSSLCTNPMLPLAGMLAIFQAMLDSPFVALKDKA